MSTFELLKQLQNPIIEEKTQLPRGIKYKEETAVVEGEYILVHVPLREATIFVESTKGKDLSSREFAELLRSTRGVRG